MNNILEAVIWMLLSAAFFACTIILVRYNSLEHHTLIVVFFRNLCGLLFMMPVLYKERQHILSLNNWQLHLWRGILALASMIVWYIALANMPLSDATTISFTEPIFATIGAFLFLNEPVKHRRWAAILIGFLGIVVFLQPQFKEINIYILYCFLFAIMTAASSLIIKTLAQTELTSRVVGLNFILLTFVSFFMVLPVWEIPTLTNLFFLFLLGVCAAVAHICYTRALAKAEISFILPIGYTKLPLVALLSFLLFQESSGIEMWVGSLLIFTSTWYIAHREYVLKKRTAPVKDIV